MARPGPEGNRRAGLSPRLLQRFLYRVFAEAFTEVIHSCRYGERRETTITGVRIIQVSNGRPDRIGIPNRNPGVSRDDAMWKRSMGKRSISSSAAT
jgi:hypothetical protein